MTDFPLNFIEMLAEQILFFPPKDQKAKALRFCTPTDQLGLFAWKTDDKGKIYNESDLFCDRRKENAAAFMRVNRRWRAAFIRQLKRCTVCVFDSVYGRDWTTSWKCQDWHIPETVPDSDNLRRRVLLYVNNAKYERKSQDDDASFNGPFIFALGFVRRLFYDWNFRPRHIYCLKMEKFIGPDLIGKLRKRKKNYDKNPEEKDVKDRQNYQIANVECSKFSANDSAKPAANDDSEWFSAEIFSGYFLRHFPFDSERWTNSAINFDSLLIGYEFDEMDGIFEMLALPSRTIKLLIPSMGDFVALQSHLPGCLHNDRTQNLMVRMYAQTDPHMLDFRSTFLFPAMVARNIFTFCRDLYQSRLRSVSISYVFTSFLGCMTMNSLKTNCLQLASLIVLNLLQLQNRRNGKKTSDNAPNDKLVDELKLGFFFQDSLNHPREFRKANFSIDPDLILPYNNTPVTPVLRICVIPDSAATTMTNAMNELTSLELANLDAIESDTLVFTVNHLLDKYSIRHYPANKKEITANPAPFSVLSIDCGIWSYEMTENGQIRSALKKQEKKKTCCCRFNKSKYGLRRYYVW